MNWVSELVDEWKTDFILVALIVLAVLILQTMWKYPMCGGMC